MLIKCVNCGFYIGKNDEFCLNCGFQNPPDQSYSEKFDYKKFLLIQAISFVIIAAIIFLISKNSDLTIPFIFGYFLVSLLMSIAITQIFSIFKSEKNFNKRYSANQNNLYQKEKIIEKRVANLDKREQKIIAVVDKIKENDSSNLQEVRRRLLSARKIVLCQFARYELQRQKIELVRLQNGVAPYLYGLHRLNDVDTENGLVTLDISKNDLGRMRQSLTSDAAIDFPEQALPERQNFLAQLAETEDSCEQLREALLSRQAARALQDISPLEENLKMPHSKELVHAAESFNIQTTLTDFSESFDELELEYKRIRAEEEIEHKLLES